MTRCLAAGICLLSTVACTSIGLSDSERTFTGVVERSQKISRAGEPSGLLMAFGAIGGLLHHAASGPTPTNLYVVKTDRGDVVTVQVDEEWAVGSCVTVIPRKGALGGSSYAYGDARIETAASCAR